MRLILVRHGETDWNVQHRVQGWIDVPLNQKGRTQAKKVALRLQNEHIGAIYSSDLKRAKYTALEIARHHKLPVKPTKLLRERNFGKLEGFPRDEYRKVRENSGIPYHLYKPPGGESYLDVSKRTRKFLAEIKKKHSNQAVLVVAHGIVIRVLISLLTKSPLEKAHEIEQHNAAVSVIELKRGYPPKVHYLNSTEHL